MSLSLDDIKLKYLQPKSQVVLLDTDGKVKASCQTLFEVALGEPVQDQFLFFDGLVDVLSSLEVNQELDFPLVEWNDQKELLLEVHLTRRADHIEWLFIDKTSEKDTILQNQQRRNDAAINEELLSIQKRFLEVEKELLDYKNQELHRLQEFKSKFFAEVSHEMRTPLNSMSGLVDLLNERLKNKEQRSLVENLSATSRHLKSIINDVLDLSKAEAGKLVLDHHPFELNKFVQATSLGLKLQAEKKGVDFVLEISSLKNKFIEGDEVRLGQVIYNLLGNSIKFTQKGKVCLTISESSSDKSYSNYKFTISDTGMGMTKDEVSKILEPYEQIEGQSHKNFGGTGLGMGIAIQLIELMGGSLSIESEKGKGTTQSFTLVFKHAEKIDITPSKESTIPDLYDQKVLIVEDDVLSRNVMYQFIEPTGAKIKLADQVEDLIILLSKNQFDYVISDLNIIGGSTLPLFKSFKGELILVSGDTDALNDIEDNYPEAQFLLKPVEKEQIYNLLQSGVLETPEFNLENLEKAAQGDNALLQIIIETMAESIPIELEKMSRANKKGDTESLKQVLHKLKPSVMYLGNDDLVNERSEIHSLLLEGNYKSGFVKKFIENLTSGLSEFLALYKK